MIASRGFVSSVAVWLILALTALAPQAAQATDFTMNVPGTSLRLPDGYPEAGGVAIVMVGANGNAYYQFSDPTGAFVGFQNTGSPTAFRGNPFTINSPIGLNCGFSDCSTYFGGSISRIYIRFSALDGDTQVGGFDQNDITLRLNGFDVGNWSNVTTQNTNVAGTVAFSTQQGFGNNTFDTGWFTSSNSALLSNILSTGQTSTQVFDRDPNDNFWNFTNGGSLTNQNIKTVAPGYSLTKQSSTPTFTAVGQTINYTYVITNIGSVPIRQLSLNDDKIASVSCDKTVILAVNPGETPDFATCTANYVVTQADFDAEKVTNIAQALGRPDFGSLGVLSATKTVTGPAIAPAISLQKTSTLSAFGAVGTSVPYSLRVENTGDATLTSVVVTDPRLPSLSCSFAALAPRAVQTCTGSYVVRQSDLDAFATSGTLLANTASVTSRDPKNVARTATSTVNLPGPTPVVSMTLAKTTTATDFSTVGTSLPYQILITNTGNVTWPAAPTVTDTLTSVSCPAGTVAPNAAITCTANYAVTQTNIDAGTINNTASATITIGTRTATASDSVSVPAVRTTGLSLDKRLALASPTSFDNSGVGLTYVYELRNTGNVTLNTVAVGDNRVAVTCPATTLAPAASMICTSASYATTQANLNAGGVTNTATATAVAAVSGETVTSNTDSVTVPAVQLPAISLNKTAPSVTALNYVAGNTVTYSFSVTNTGNVRINSADQITITDDKIGTFNCGTGDLFRGATRVCTANYVLKPADILAGLVVNEAVANAGTIAKSNVDTATISPSFSPALSIVKSADRASVSALTDVITYSFLVTNAGNNQIIKSGNPITVSDPMVGTVDCSAQPAVLASNGSFTCTATYSPTQAQLNAGRVQNTATASYPFVNGGSTTTVTSPSSTVTVPVVETVALTLDKTGPASFTAVGQSLSFGFSVTNNGNTTLTSTTVTDPLIPGLSCTLTNIAPLASASCTGTYVVTQANMDAGVINNTAIAQGRTAQGGTGNDNDAATVPVSPAVVLKSATFDKTANKTSFASVGEQITYTLAVSNTGAQTLRNIAVTDSLNASFSCAIPVLLPSVTNSSCTYVHVVTQADIDAGSVVNAASAVSADFPATLTDSVTVTGPARAASYSFTKTADGPFVAKDDIVTFTLAVTNTGTVTLSNVQITDSFFTPAVSCTIPTLLPGAVNSTCQASYTVTQTDVDNGQITNTASISASAPVGVTPPTATTATAVVQGPVSAPAVSIAKTPSATTYAAVNDVINYTFAVTNSGNVTLTNLSVTDTALGFSCLLDDLAPQAVATTCTGGAPALSASKTITQTEIDGGAYINTASVSGQSRVGGTTVSDSDIVTATGPVQNPTLSIAKASALGGTFNVLNQSIPYEYTVTNTGNITMTGVFSVTDNKIANVSCPALPAAGLAPNASIVCTGTYLVTQTDLDAGFVTNLASASTVQPVIPQNPGDPAFKTVPTGQVPATVYALQQPKLTLDKRVKSSSTASYSALDNTVVFEYVVTNSGNVTTTAPITIADDKIAGTLTCGAAGLAPGASVTCEQPWTATQTALNDGEVTNIGTASTVFNAATVDSNNDSVTITAVQNPSLAIAKSLASPIPLNFSAGETLNYEYVVTNNGNVSINGISTTNLITVSDNLTAVSCPVTPVLAPAASITCTASYTLGFSDLQLGSTTNVAVASGEFDGVTIRSPQASVLFPVGATPAITLAKSTTATALPVLGATVVYSYTVTNPIRNPGQAGVDLVEDIYVDDDKIGRFLCRPSSAGIFRIGDSYTCTQPYVVTQADLDANTLTNNAIADTLFAGTIPVASASRSVTLTGTANPLLTMEKLVTSGNNPVAVGETLGYTITTTNSGNQTIRGVSVTDAMLGTLACTLDGVAAAGNVVLAPTKALVCTGSYVVKQTDIDNQALRNFASARGSNPLGGTVTATDDVTHPVALPVPGLEVTKVITPAPGPDDAFSAVGQDVTFLVTVRNTGNVTLTSTTVTDDLVDGSCTVGALAPGASDSSCEFVYIVKQSDIDALNGPLGAQFGGFTNTATGVAQPANPGAATISDDGDVFARGPAREPALALVKQSLAADFDAFGDVITYQFTVANTGNVTLTQPISVTDAMLGAPFVCGSLPAGGLLPGEFMTCTRDYAVTQADVDAGAVTNVATVASDDVPLPANVADQGNMRATATVNGVRTPAMTVEKVASITTGAKVGDVIDYTYTVTNSGNVTLTNVTPTDQHSSAAGTVALTIAGDALTTDLAEQGNSTDGAAAGIWGNLGPGDAVSFTSSYTVTQADIDQGVTISNTVQVAAGSPAGTTAPTATDTVTVAVEAAAGQMTAIKAVAATLSTPPAIGDVLTYTITLTNTGNVTLSDVTPTDTFTDAKAAALTLLPALTGPSGDDGDGLLQVDEVWTYSAGFALTQQAIDAGGVSNSISFAANDPFDTALTPEVSDDDGTNADDPTVTALTRRSELTLVKAAVLNDGGDGRVDAGDTIRYSYTVNNIGNTSIFDVALTETGFTGTGTRPVPVLQTGGADLDGEADAVDLAAGTSATYAVTYTLTQADIDAGGVDNQATVTGDDPDGEEVSDLSGSAADNDDPTTTPITPDALMDVQKRADISLLGAPVLAGQTINYTITVENTGNVTLSAVTPVDTLLDANGDALELTSGPTYGSGDDGDGLLQVGETWTYLASFDLTQVAIDAGGVSNSVIVTAKTPDDNGISDTSDDDGTNASDPTLTTLTPAPDMLVLKTVSATLSTPAKPGDLLTYTITVDNTGNVSLKELVLIDTLTNANNTDLALLTGPTKQAGDTGADDILGVDEIWTYTATYALTQDDIDSGGVSNTLTVDAKTPKDVTETDVSDDDGTNGEDPTVTSITRSPVIAAVKSASLALGADGVATVGDVVTYTYTVENTGNVTVLDLGLTETGFTGTGTLPVPAYVSGGAELGGNAALIDLAVGASAQWQATYALTQSDIDAGGVDNQATASGTDPNGDPVSDLTGGANGNNTVTALNLTRAPAMNVEKTADTSGLASPAVAGNSVGFTVRVANTGNVTLSTVTLNETFTRRDGTALEIALSKTSGDAGVVGILEVGETWVYTGSYALIQDDIDAGGVQNTVTANAVAPGAVPVQDVSDDGNDSDGNATNDPTVVNIAGAPNLSVVKALATGSTAPFTTLGQVLDYTFTVTNTGNITITEQVQISDPLIENAGGAISCGASPILRNATITCTGSYAVTQADLDRGSVENTATALVSQPVLPFVPGGADTVDVTSDASDVTARAQQLPAMTLLKRIKAGSATSFAAVGDVVTFEYVVRNSGNVTLLDPITITDDKIAGTLACATGPLAPLAQVVCEQDWVATQADLNLASGIVTNSAVANTTFDGDPVPSPARTATITAVQNPKLEFVKTLTSAVPDLFDVGTVLSYDFVVTNTGNVTIDGPITVADSITTVTCDAIPATGLLPNESVDCAATYTLRPGDIELGSTVNVASASGSFAGVPVTSASDEAIYPVGAAPAIRITKDSVPADVTFDFAGQVVTYSYTITNTGKAGFTEAIEIVDNRIGTFVCLPDTADVFNVGAVHSCTQDYTVTQADLDREFVTNEASAKTVFAPGTVNEIAVTTPVATKTVTAVPEALLTLEKSVVAGPSPAALGDVLSYRILATNNGNQTLSALSIADPRITTLSCTKAGAALAANVVLLPGEAVECLGDYTVTQADVDAQSLTNTASASANDPSGATVRASDTHDQPVAVANPGLEVVKTLLPTPATGVAFTAKGKVLTFMVTLRNTGNVTLNNLSVTDDLVAGECTLATLLPGASNSACRFTYTTTQADVNALNGAGPFYGGFTNVATGQATPANPRAEVIEDLGSVFVRGPNRAPAFTLAKTASVSVAQGFGDPIRYTYVVTNSGNVTLVAAPVVTDDKIANITCAPMPAGGLAPAAQLVCSADYVVTQDDADAGFVTNNASVTSTEVTLPATDTVTVPIARGPGLSVVKAASITADAKLGDVIDYTYTVTNTGNVVLTGVSLSDQHSSAAGSVALAISGDRLVSDGGALGNATDAATDGVWDQLGPDDVVEFKASYTVTQADIDAGAVISNTVQVTGQGPSGTTPPVATDRVAVAVAVSTPAIAAVKTFDASSMSSPPVAGEVVSYTIRISNTGNVTLNTITLQDRLRRADATVLALTSGPDYVSGNAATAAMEIGEEWVYAATYKLTQADIDAGGITNQVIATGLAPNGDEARDVSDDETTTGNDPTALLIAADPSIEGIKTIVTPATEVGGVVEFEIAATNTGNVTLTGVAIPVETLKRLDGTALLLTSQPAFNGASMGSGLGTLLPGEVATYRATYRLVQADLDAGGISNSATVSGRPPIGSAVTDISDDGDVGAGDTGRNPTVQAITAAPAMRLVKALAEGSGPVYTVAGQVLTYQFTVTNTGNVTITDAIRISDPRLGPGFACGTMPAGGLAPLAAQTCTANYTVTQADVDAGQISNTATASDGTTPSLPSTVVTEALQAPVLAVVKAASDVTAAEFVTGKVVDYTYTVTNAGNVTVRAPITIDDNRIDAAAITCPALPAGGLLPGGVLQCRASYVVTSDDVDLGTVTNLASASDGVTVSPLVSVTVPNEGEPALDIVKTASVADFAAVGDTISYSYRVTNTGTRAYVAPVTVVDDILGEIACFAPTSADPDLTAGEVVTCTAQHVVTQADLDRGNVTNQAYARTTYGGGSVEVASDPDTVVVPAARAPELSLTKTSTPNPVSGVGEVVAYRIVAQNTGNQTLRNVSVTDPMLPALSCTVAVLAPGQSLPCSATYTVQQSDIDRGTLVNTAYARGVTPQGVLERAEATETTGLPAADAAVSLVKTTVPATFGAVGSNLTYRFTATNTGNVTLTNLTVTDPMDAGYACTIAELAPAAVDSTCRMTVVVTQAHVDAGEIDNTANISGTAPNGGAVQAAGSVTTQGPTRVPALDVTKTVQPSASVVGGLVRFQLLVRNAGNVTLTPSAPVDVMVRLNGDAAPLDAPFALISGDAGTVGKLDVGETWVYSAARTLTLADVDAGGLRNTARVSATAEGLGTVTDVSDNGNDADGNSVNDPTIFNVARTPSLNLTKVVSAAEGNSVGDRITFELTALNTGNVTLTEVAMSDTLTRANGTSITGVILTGGASSLAPGEDAVWTLVHTLTQPDIDAGGLENTAVVSGLSPDGSTVTDRSNNGDNGDGNVGDDPTTYTIVAQPALTVVKALDSIGTAANEVALFTITATNSGTVTLTGVTVSDQLTQLGTETDLGALTPVFVGNSNGSAAGTLQAGEVATWTVRYVLTQADVDAGGIRNTARVVSRAPNGAVISDVSDDDGSGESDATAAVITGAPALEVVKSASTPERLFPTIDRVTFTLLVTNTGNVTQTGISLVDDLTSFLATASLVDSYPIVVTATGFGTGTANPSYNGLSVTETLAGNATLAPRTSGTVTITVVTSSAVGAPVGENIGRASSAQSAALTLSNPVTVDSTDSDGDGVPDAIEGTGDRDGDGINNSFDYDPTGTFYCQDTGRLLSGGNVSVTGPLGTQSGVGTSNGITIVRDGSDGRFQFFVTVAGSYTLGLRYPAGGVPSTTRLGLGTLDVTSLLPSNPASVGSGEVGSTGTLSDFSAAANRFYTTFQIEAGDPFVLNNNIPLEACASTPDVSVTKTADRSSVVYGETVNFTLTYENNTAQTYVGANLVDTLPDGLVYTAGSGLLDGVAVDPVVTGKRLAFGPVTVAPAQKLVLRLAARVSARGSYGELTNRGWMEDASGAVLSNIATATVKITPEAVFDCTDIIGKVFDDKNHNGYQDARGGGEVTNQDIFLDKLGKLAMPVKPVDTSEPGLPGVRLATVNGLLITTDEYGRFHVPCAALPKGIGSNFALKVDTRTLPLGFRMTTENPRVMRVTAGKMTKMNFGATASKIIDIDLTRSAFVSASADPSAAFAKAVTGLVDQIKTNPTTLRLSYHATNGEDRALATERLKAAERVIRKAWRGVGRYELEIDRSVKWVQ